VLKDVQIPGKVLFIGTSIWIGKLSKKRSASPPIWPGIMQYLAGPYRTKRYSETLNLVIELLLMQSCHAFGYCFSWFSILPQSPNLTFLGFHHILKITALCPPVLRSLNSHRYTTSFPSSPVCQCQFKYWSF
jgi:hypothetical protein